MNDNQRKKLIKGFVITLIIIFIAIIIYSISYLVHRALNPAAIEILVAPHDASLTIDGKKYNTNTTIYTKEGEYSYRIERDGFIELTGSITAKNNETVYLYEYLNPEDNNSKYYEENEEDKSRKATIEQKHASLFQDNYSGSDRIWTITPYDNYKQGIKITAKKGEDKTTINVYLYTCLENEVEQFTNKANNYLKEKGIILENYNIDYKWC